MRVKVLTGARSDAQSSSWMALAGGATDAAVVVDDEEDDDDEEEAEPPPRFCCFSASFAARAIITCSFFLRSSICFFCNQDQGAARISDQRTEV